MANSGNINEVAISRDNSKKLALDKAGDVAGTDNHTWRCNADKFHLQGDPLKWEAIESIRKRDGYLRLSHFKTVKQIGYGQMSIVYLSELVDTNCNFAIKEMEKSIIGDDNKPLYQNERDILELLNHPLLPTLYCHFETENFSYLVMDFCPGGDLEKARQMCSSQHFSEELARFYAAEVLVALEYLHVLGVLYIDLKPENVLIKEDGHIVLTDFDLCVKGKISPTLVKSPTIPKSLGRSWRYFIEPALINTTAEDSLNTSRWSSCSLLAIKRSRPSSEKNTDTLDVRLMEIVAEPTGCRCSRMSLVKRSERLAPEMIKAEKVHGSSLDWWAFGVFVYELLFGQLPFKRSNDVMGEPLTFPKTPAVSYAAKDLLRGLLVKNPEQRLASTRGVAEIKHHPFFKGVCFPLILCYTTPPQSITPSAAARHSIK